MNPLKIYDIFLSTDVNLYKLGLPDPFGANALIYYDGSKTDYTGELSVLNGNPMWITTNVKRLSAYPISGGDSSYLTSSDISASYINQHIYLSVHDQVVGDINCADFIKDGMLSSVELCGSQLVFTFNTDHGGDPVSVDLSSIASLNVLSDYALISSLTAYALKSDIPTAAEISSEIHLSDYSLTSHSHDGTYVQLSGDETIAGIKTFSKAITLGFRGSSGTVGNASLAVGVRVNAGGIGSFSQGSRSDASPNGSFAAGNYAQALNAYENSIGYYNKSNKATDTFPDSGNTLHSIGFGSNSTRKNAVEVMQDGKVFVNGLGEYDGTNPTDANVKDLVASIKSKADDVSAVHTTGNETIAGTKTFTNSLSVAPSLAYRDGLTVNSAAVIGTRKAGTTIGSYSFVHGIDNTASGVGSVANGKENVSDGNYTHAEGFQTHASYNYSHAEGYMAVANQNYAHAEGSQTSAVGQCSHAEGKGTNASGENSHAEGRNAKAIGECSHAEGVMTTASGDFAHAEGMAVDVKSGLVEYKLGGGASGMASKVEGFGCTASGKGSYAGGVLAEAADDVSFVWNDYGESLPDAQGVKDLLHGDSTADANAALAIIQSIYNSRDSLKYSSKSAGSFCINPKPANSSNDPATGFFIGEQSLADRLSSYISKDPFKDFSCNLSSFEAVVGTLSAFFKIIGIDEQNIQL